MKCTDAARGPRLVFFTGGTALRDLSRTLSQHTRNSIHIVTPFDSGGSTAALRRAFAMPAVGDMRNRLLALADTSAVPPQVLAFCEARLPDTGDGESLRQELRRMGQADHAVWRDMPPNYAEALRRHLTFFLCRMPQDFAPHRASLGNLILAGGYLEHRRDFGPILAMLGQLLQVRGVVCPSVTESLHLAAELADGSVLVGQHRFKDLTQPVRRLFLTVHEPERPGQHVAPQTPCRPPLAAEAAAWLRAPALICYPMGSFYTSVLANLLPQGVGRAIAAAPCPKVFIPNSGRDPELCGLSLVGQVGMLLRQLREDAPHTPTEALLHWVVLDERNGVYPGGTGAALREALARMGVGLLCREMVSPADAQRHLPEQTVRVLLELAARGEGQP